MYTGILDANMSCSSIFQAMCLTTANYSIHSNWLLQHMANRGHTFTAASCLMSLTTFNHIYCHDFQQIQRVIPSAEPVAQGVFIPTGTLLGRK